MNRWTQSLREFYRVQVRLWEGYGRRQELPGLRARGPAAPPAPLRWVGDRLEGTVLPEQDRPG